MIVSSFSGGKTSAYMTWWLKNNTEEELVVLFANTGQEHPNTLDFVNRCDIEWGLNVVWLEADVQPELGIGTKYKIVDYGSASRDGKPFEDVIKKYGIPNQSYLHCTREMKLAPINAWAKDHCPKDRKMAVGIRVDEIDRMQADAKAKNIIYPLVSMNPTDKRKVDRFWEVQPFTLDIPPLLGNCTWCWKKTLRKHLTLIKSNPEIYEFPARMEREYAMCGSGDDPRVFFRGNKSTQDLIQMAKNPFMPWHEDYQPSLFNEFDVSDGCVEGCEVEF